MEALAPKMSAETFEYHYGKHLQTYVDNLNRLIAGTPYEEMSLEEIIRKADGGMRISTGDTFRGADRASIHTQPRLFTDLATEKVKNKKLELWQTISHRKSEFVRR